MTLGKTIYGVAVGGLWWAIFGFLLLIMTVLDALAPTGNWTEWIVRFFGISIGLAVGLAGFAQMVRPEISVNASQPDPPKG